MSSTTPVAPPGVFPPPPGQVANFTDPPQHTNGLVPLIIIFTTLSTTFLGLRLFTKARILKLLGWEDVAITVAWLSNITLMGLYIKGLQLGAGSHIWNFTMENYPLYARLATAADLIYSPLTGFPKIAILLFYLRINPSRSFRLSTFAVIFFVWAYIIALLLVQLFACNPVKKLWEPLVEGKCINERPVFLTIPIAGTILDVCVLVLPIPMLVKLQANMRTKLALGGIFSVCSCTVVISALRIWSVSKLLETPDLTWNAAVSNCLTVAETNMMIVCGSVLVLRPFCRRYLPFMLGSDRIKASHETLGVGGGLFMNGKGTPNYDGPMGPRSKSQYRTKVSGGKSGGSSKRGLWGIGFGSTTLMEDDDDLESLSAELKRLPPTAGSMGNVEMRNTYDRVDHYSQKNGYGADHNNVKSNSDGIGEARSDFGNRSSNARIPAEETEAENGIVKTVSLDVR